MSRLVRAERLAAAWLPRFKPTGYAPTANQPVPLAMDRQLLDKAGRLMAEPRVMRKTPSRRYRPMVVLYGRREIGYARFHVFYYHRTFKDGFEAVYVANKLVEALSSLYEHDPGDGSTVKPPRGRGRPRIREVKDAKKRKNPPGGNAGRGGGQRR